MTNGKVATLNDVRDELRINNRLMIISLVRDRIQQKDIAASIGISESALSLMFPKGLLRRVAKSRALVPFEE
jgi:predicted transcriptional regulator